MVNHTTYSAIATIMSPGETSAPRVRDPGARVWSLGDGESKVVGGRTDEAEHDADFVAR